MIYHSIKDAVVALSLLMYVASQLWEGEERHEIAMDGSIPDSTKPNKNEDTYPF